MPSGRMVCILVATLLAVQVFPLVPPAMAQTNNGNYVFLLASGFLCNPGDSATCPATARGNQGDSFEISGAGTFDAQSKSVKAAGTFTHKSPNGNVLETGVWLANELVSFDSYGIAPNAIPNQAKGLGPGVMGATRVPMMNRGPMPTGGLAVLRILLMPISGNARTGELQINCALGNVPNERSVEGVRLVFDGGGNEFAEESGGRVMFLSVRGTTAPRANVVKPENTSTAESSH